MSAVSTLLIGGEIICLGIFTGLMLTLIVIIEPMLNDLPDVEYMVVLQRFLKFANKNPIITLNLLVAALFPLPELFNAPIGNLTFTLTILAWLIFMVGVIVVTMHLNLPLYRKIMRCDAQFPTASGRRMGKQWYVLNSMRGFAAGIALVLFLVVFVRIG